MKPRIVILSYPGAMQSAVLGLADILEFAGLFVHVVTNPDDAPSEFQGVVLPPAATIIDPASEPDVVSWLSDVARNGGLMCSACVGITWIAEAGIDRGRPVTTHSGIDAQVRKRWPHLQLHTDRLIIEYPDLVTAGGLMAWIDLALIIVERLIGHAEMLETARHFVVEPGRRDQRKFQRFHPIMDHGDAQVLRVQHVLQDTKARNLTVPQMASEAGLSTRSLQRRFLEATGLNITHYVQRVRIEHAKSMLTHTDRPVSDIAAQSGYSDIPAFHRMFRRITGTTPSTFRKNARA